MPSRTLYTACAAAIMALSSAGVPAAGQTPAYKAPRLKGTEHPDLNGLWQALNEANWDIQAHAAQPGPPQFGALYALAALAGLAIFASHALRNSSRCPLTYALASSRFL